MKHCNKSPAMKFIYFIMVLGLIFSLSACNSSEPAPEEIPDQASIITAWESSAHGNTYDLGKGPNTYCSRCHSPKNWDPASTTDTPPNCVTCKFPTDDTIRMASTMDFVEEEDWFSIDCETCHMLSDGSVLAGIAWRNPLTGEHEEVGTPNEICTKCHLTSAGVSATNGTGVTHEIYLGGSAHKNWAGQLSTTRKPEYCTDCHDPHTQTPKQCVDCHDDVLTLDTHIKGMNAFHVNISCMACHDATEMEVGPHPDEEMGGKFVTLVSSVGRAGPTVEYVKSHSPQWQVSCNRCHFEENQWDLIVLTEDGEIPEPE